MQYAMHAFHPSVTEDMKACLDGIGAEPCVVECGIALDKPERNFF